MLENFSWLEFWVKVGESYARRDGWRKIIWVIYHVQFLRSRIALSLYNIITGRVFSILIWLIHIYEKIFMRFVFIEYFAETRVIYKRYQGILHRTRTASLLLFCTTHCTERCRNAKQRSPFRAGQIDRLKWPIDRLKDSDSGFNPEIRSDCDSFSASSNKGKKHDETGRLRAFSSPERRAEFAKVSLWTRNGF